MKRKFLKERGGIAGLLVILLSVCLALCIWLTLPRTVYAETVGQVANAETRNGDGGTPDTPSGNKSQNRWLVSPSVLSWKYGEYDPAVNVINAVPAYGQDRTQIYISNESQDKALSFILNADGTVPDEASEKLAELDAGDYYLLASVSGTDSYYGLNDGVSSIKDGVKFSVLRINNSWRTTPNIVQWTWGGFNRDKNLITAVPSYPQDPAEVEVKFGVYTDASCYDSYVVKGLEEFTSTAGKVSSSVARILSNLNAGTYYLFATSAGSVNYTQLSSIIQFDVQSVQNHWTTTPNIVQWRWGEYNRENNLIDAEPANGGIEDVVYGIYSDEYCNEAVSEEFSYNKVINRVTGEDGTLESSISYNFDDWVYKFLDDLNAGTYYLKAEVPADGNGNYTRLSSVISFGVQNVQNHWATTPSILTWKYSEYDKNVNLIQARPALGGSAEISIYHSDGDAVLFDKGGEIVSSFNLEETGGALTVPEYTENVFKNLSVGTYYMLARVSADENGNFNGLNNYTSVEDIKTYGIEFVISPVQNSWITVPQMLSWSEGHYDSEINKITAEARVGNDRMVVYFIEGVDGNGRVITTNAGGNEIDYEAIAKLPVGSYSVRYEIRGNDNYTALEGMTTFAVFEDSVGLEGIISAVIVFAVIDVFALGACIVLMIFRRKKIENAYRAMINKELHRR